MGVEEVLELAERPRLPSPDEARRILKSGDVQIQELAHAIGVHPVTVSKWLSGAQRPTGARAQVYGRALALLKANAEKP